MPFIIFTPVKCISVSKNVFKFLKSGKHSG